MFCDVPFRDAYRAQYYLTTLQTCAEQLNQKFSNLKIFGGQISDAIHDFIVQIATEADQILLPTFAFEISEAKSSSDLIGDTPEARYVNFFEENQAFTQRAKAIIEKYPFLFEMVDQLIISSFQSLELCLERFLNDHKLVTRALIRKISAITASDRHRGHRALLFEFSDSSKLIYKAVNLQPDELYARYIEKLKLPYPYDLRPLKIISRKDYGWIEFIPYQPCQTIEEIKNFYRRAGVLLAITDSLHYTDGHFENVIAMGQYPVLLDGETFFQNYSAYTPAEKSILSTLLIQKITSIDEFGAHSALQSSDHDKCEQFYTYALYDHTDKIEVHFQGTLNERTHNCPSFNNTTYSGIDFVDELIEGFSVGYDRISDNLTQILSDKNWWNAIASAQSRVVLRQTSAYAFLLRRIQQPDACSSRDTARAMLSSKITDSLFSDYEINDLLTLNVPYFYQCPGEKNLYNGRGECYKNAFPISTLQNIKHQLNHRSNELKAMNISIIDRHMRSLPKNSGAICYAN